MEERRVKRFFACALLGAALLWPSKASAEEAGLVEYDCDMKIGYLLSPGPDGRWKGPYYRTFPLRGIKAITKEVATDVAITRARQAVVLYLKDHPDGYKLPKELSSADCKPAPEKKKESKPPPPKPEYKERPPKPLPSAPVPSQHHTSYDCRIKWKYRFKYKNGTEGPEKNFEKLYEDVEGPLSHAQSEARRRALNDLGRMTGHSYRLIDHPEAVCE